MKIRPYPVPKSLLSLGNPLLTLSLLFALVVLPESVVFAVKIEFELDSPFLALFERFPRFGGECGQSEFIIQIKLPVTHVPVQDSAHHARSPAVRPLHVFCCIL